jgi:hypothetical protein
VHPRRSCLKQRYQMSKISWHSPIKG